MDVRNGNAESEQTHARKDWGAAGAGILIAIALIAAVFYAESLSKERGSIDVYGRRLSDLPALARLTHQQAAGRVSQEVPGQLLGVHLRERNATLVYEVKWADMQRQTAWIFLIDAGSGEVLSKREIPNTRFLATR